MEEEEEEEEGAAAAVIVMTLLGGSWVLISGVVTYDQGSYIYIYIFMTHIGGLRTPCYALAAGAYGNGSAVTSSLPGRLQPGLGFRV